jgi:hypothetical protein
MSTLLLLTSERLDKEIRRANDAERKNAETMAILRSTIETKTLALQETARVSEELALYKLQFDNAQREIYKAQDLINQIEAQRREAEDAAARARTTARKLKEQNLVMLAKEEGRRLGYREGLARGRRMGYDEGRAVRFSTSRRDDYVDRSDDEFISDERDYVTVERPSNVHVHSPWAAPAREREPSGPQMPRYIYGLLRVPVADVCIEAPSVGEHHTRRSSYMRPLFLFQCLPHHAKRLSHMHLLFLFHGLLHHTKSLRYMCPLFLFQCLPLQ